MVLNNPLHEGFLLDLQFFIYVQLVIVIDVYFVDMWTELQYSDSTQARRCQGLPFP